MNHSTALTIRTNSLRATISASLLALIALILLATPALAAAPAEGIVYEGKSVPGAALGATRAQVVRSYGEPMQCNDLSITRTYTCTFKVAGGGVVDITFIRSQSSLTPVRYDTVSFIRWSQEVSGWITTAGVNTALALEEPRAVVEAYPNAAVKFDSQGEIIQVRDSRLGIQVDWQTSVSFSDVQRHVSMSIFRPTQITMLDN